MRSNARRLGVRTRLLLVLVITFLPLVVLEAALLQQHAETLRQSVVDERTALVRSEAHAAGNFVEGNLRTLEGLARLPLIRDPKDTDELNETLRAIAEENPVWLTLALSGADGLNISSLTTPPGSVDITDRDYFQGAIEGQRTVGSAILTRGELNVKSIIVAVPVRLDAGGRAVLSAALSLERLEGELRDSLPTGIQLSVVDRRGQEFIGPGPLGVTFPVVSDRPGVEAAMRGETGAAILTVEGREHLVAYAPAGTAGWAMVLREPAEAAFAGIDRQRQTALLLTGLAIAIAFVAAAYLGTRLERTYRDIELARGEVEAERGRLSDVVNELPAPVALYDPQGRIVLRNQAYVRRLGGHPPETAVGVARFYDVRRGDGSSFPQGQLPIQRALRGEVVRTEQILLRQPETGEDLHMLLNAVPLIQDGEVRGGLVVMQDISELKRFEEERTAFFEMASHEIKTPLTALLGHVQLALRRARRGERERIDEVLVRADEGGRRLAELVRDLLDLTRLDAGRLELQRAPADVGALVAGVVDEIRPMLERHEVALEPPARPLTVEVDPRRVTQILQNVLDNAARYSPEGGRIAVTVRSEGADAVVRVTDQGVGIPEEEQPLLFQRFFRTTRTQPMGGTGLGLFISRRIAEAHGGRLWLERSGPEGTTFALAIPLAGADKPLSFEAPREGAATEA